jgi:Tfp pilus assembly protein PilN
MEAVNLLPAYARPGHPWAAIGKDLPARRVLTAGGAVAGAAAIAFGAAFVHERSLVKEKQDTLAGVQAQLVEVQAKAEPLRAAESASATKLVAVRTISAGRVPWENVLRNLARVLPSGVQLQSLQATSPTAIAPGSTAGAVATAGAPTGFTVAGSASSQNRVALVLDRLAVLPWLSDVTLQSSTRGTGTTGSSSTDQFTISANFNSAGGAK